MALRLPFIHMDMTTGEVIEGLEEVFGSLISATDRLDEAFWAIETACPGWDVQDQISHLVGIERSLQGAVAPSSDVGDLAHIRNPIGAMNELWVDSLRQRSGEDVRSEFIEVTAERLSELRASDEATFDAIGWSPIGQVPMRKFMEVRIMDSWIHEQDIRGALDRPGGRNGIGEAVTLGRIDLALGVVVGKGAQAPEGASVTLEIIGPIGGRRRVEVIDGRALLKEGPEADATIILSQETYERRFGGRMSTEEALAAPGTSLGGDAALGAAVLDALCVMI